MKTKYLLILWIILLTPALMMGRKVAPKKPEAPVTGLIEKIDVSSREVMVRGLLFKVTDFSKIIVGCALNEKGVVSLQSGAKPKSMAALKVGDTVSVVYEINENGAYDIEKLLICLKDGDGKDLKRARKDSVKDGLEAPASDESAQR